MDTSINLSKGLLVYYPFNNSAADSSGNQRNGTITGSLQYSTDKNNTVNGAALFDGTSTYITLTDNGSLSPSSLTVCGQFYSTTTAQQNVFSKVNPSNANSISWGLALFGNAPGYAKSASFGVRGTSVACGSFDPMSYSDLVYSMADIQTSQWYHVACVFDKGVEKIYLNGTLRHAITRDFQTPKQCSEASVMIGFWYQGAPFYYKGKMDEFRMYNRALNDQEIAQLGKGF
ncbi:MAG TPA: LamG domain-containing protein [Segetibacter sp.]|nr:LamG domain-containing protein [Segetibacter sp.]